MYLISTKPHPLTGRFKSNNVRDFGYPTTVSKQLTNGIRKMDIIFEDGSVFTLTPGDLLPNPNVAKQDSELTTDWPTFGGIWRTDETPLTALQSDISHRPPLHE